MPTAVASSPSFYADQGGEVRPSLAAANAWCEKFARDHAENFTAASWLLPRHLRQHFVNIYAWCRWADDLADDGGDAQQRLALLDDWETQLHRCAAGEADDPIGVALAATIHEFDLPLEPFCDLLAAFRQDQRQSHYESFDELLAYCRLSANPVGRLVLRLGRCDNAANVLLSDSICTGLQLVNFWQDVRRDYMYLGRVYLPRETLRNFGVDQSAIEQGVATAAFRAAIGHEVQRAEGFLRAGWPLVECLSPTLRVDVELFIRGGLAAAQAIRQQNFDVLTRRPVVGKAKKLQLLAATILRQKVFGRHGASA
jgi:squalene synthase HpnC